MITPLIKDVERNADGTIMKTILTTHHEVIIESQLKDVLGFTRKTIPLELILERSTYITNIDENDSKSKCTIRFILKGRNKIIRCFILSALLTSRKMKELTTLSLRNRKNEH